MFNISALKEMKLAELQEIAKLAKTIKIAGAKKDTLIAQILEHQNAAAVDEEPKVSSDSSDSEKAKQKPLDNKTKRARISPESKKASEAVQSDLFAEDAEAVETPAPLNKNPKFKKPLFKKENNSINFF